MPSIRVAIGSVLAAWCTFACSAPPAPPPASGEAQEHEAHEHDKPSAQGLPPTAASANGAALVRLDEHAHVCMLSNRYLGERPHVPVEVDGKTYYGCCANCAARLAQQAEAREARDAWTGHTIDKGSAIRARDTQNRVLYFENEQSFAQMQHSLSAP